MASKIRDQEGKPGKEKEEPSVEALYQNRLERTLRTHVGLVEVTAASWEKWRNPFGEKVGPNGEDGFQRTIQRNKYVIEVAHTISSTGIIPGQIVIGIFQGILWLIDGQHRRESFTIAVLGECGVTRITKACANIKYEVFDTWAAMSDRYVELQRKIRGNSPNDMLKGLEASTESLQVLRKRFPAVGYTSTRPDSKHHKGRVSAKAALQAWYGSKPETPGRKTPPPFEIAKQLTVEEAHQLANFLRLAHSAWAFDPNYLNLWGSLNLTLCLWLYRRCVLDPVQGFPDLTPEQFASCLTALPSEKIGGVNPYAMFLYRKGLRELDRGPVYMQVTRVFTATLRANHKLRVKFPKPEWAEWKAGG